VPEPPAKPPVKAKRTVRPRKEAAQAVEPAPVPVKAAPAKAVEPAPVPVKAAKKARVKKVAGPG
jgi:hypothetical protein